MKIFTKKSSTQKIILTVLIVILCNFIFPTYSRAGIGGILFDPITNLVTTVGDSILAILQNFLYNGEYNVVSGLSSIMLKAGFFVNNRDKYPDMDYTGNTSWSEEEAKENGVAVIDEDEFDQISLYDAAAFLVNPVVGGIVLVADLAFAKNYIIPTVQYSADKIFAGKVPAFDINFIQPRDWENDEQNKISITRQLNGVISSWYVSLRNLSIVILLSVLVYTGIRIIISSSADDKAKYKQRLLDWVVAMCLLFFMHYIMTFILSMIDMLNNTIGDKVISMPVWITGSNIQYNTDLMGLIRLQVQYKDFTPKLIYTIFYIALLVYTCKFSWVYLKRAVTMAFLTMIAPLVAMTYPIDKMNDGKAQAFNAWLKEYIFTALLQPFHLIIYTVLVGSSMEIAVRNPLYAIMVIAFIGPAEKLLRKFFGFDKASTPGALSQAGAMFGGAAAWNMVKRGAERFIDKKGGKGGQEGGGKGPRTAKGVEDQNAPSTIGDVADKLNDQNGDNPTLDDEGPKSKLGQLGQSAGAWTKGKMDGIKGATGQLTGKLGQATLGLTRKAKGMIPQGIKSEYSNVKSDLAKTALGKRYTGIRNASKEKLRQWANNNINLKDPRVRKKLGKKALRLAGKAAVTGTMGAIGIGAGIAGDDLEDVLKYGAAGAALGYTMAPGMGRKIANSGAAKAVKEGYGRAVYGNDNKAEVEAEKQRLFESGEMLEEAETYYDENGNHYTGEELTKLEERLIEHKVAGVSSASDRKKAIKLEDKARKELYKNLPPPDADDYDKELQKCNELAKAKSEVAVKVASSIESKKLNTANGQDEIRSLFKKELSNKGIKGDILNNESEQMLDLVLSYHKKPKM